MEIIDLYNLTNACRGCLKRTESAVNLFEHDDILTMFLSVIDFKIQKSDILPNRICEKCEEKLRITCEFRSQCQENQELLRKYMSDDFDKKLDVPVTNTQEVVCEETTNEQIISKQTMRLEQFSYDEVHQVIEERNQKFLENRNCIKCNFKGTNARALAVHVAHVHKELKERWCSTCNKEFDSLSEHMKQHKINDLKCQFCGKIFGNMGHFKEHLLSHTRTRPFKCDVCEKCFISSRHLRIHYKVHSNERPFQCKFCAKSFIRYASVKAHLQQAHSFIEDESYECKEELEVRNISDMKKQKYPEPQNFCTICNRKVRSLNVHKNRYHNEHDKEKKVEAIPDGKLCTVCGKQLKSGWKLKVHMMTHTGETPYTCSYCGKKVKTRNILVLHERTHTGERPHVCTVCKKAFSQSSVLKTHMRLHTGRPEVCFICGRRFCRPAELKIHMRKHTGEKPFVCSECGQDFIQRSHLMEHIKIHTDDRPYKCPFCERAFRQNSSLKTHAQIHLGHKPFRCSQCSYACRQSYSLTLHMRQHSNDTPKPEKPHLCVLCQKSYSTLAMLTSHSMLAHADL